MDSNLMGYLPLPATPSFPFVPSAKQGSEIDAAKMKKAAKGFESYFTYTLLKEMQKTTPKGSMFGTSPGNDIYQHLFQQSMADMLASQNGLGISKMIVDHLENKEKQAAMIEQHKGEKGPIPLTAPQYFQPIRR